MPTYILLMKLTEQGAKDIKNAPQRVEKAAKTVTHAAPEDPPLCRCHCYLVPDKTVVSRRDNMIFINIKVPVQFLECRNKFIVDPVTGQEPNIERLGIDLPSQEYIIEIGCIFSTYTR